jgi:hypothetical protein
MFESEREVFIRNSPSVVIWFSFMHFVVFSGAEYMNNMEQYDFHVLTVIKYIYQLH